MSGIRNGNGNIFFQFLGPTIARRRWSQIWSKRLVGTSCRECMESVIIIRQVVGRTKKWRHTPRKRQRKWQKSCLGKSLPFRSTFENGVLWKEFVNFL